MLSKTDVKIVRFYIFAHYDWKENGFFFILIQCETVDIKIINTAIAIAINRWAHVYNFSIGKRHLGDNDAFGKRGRLDEVIANDYFPSI